MTAKKRNAGAVTRWSGAAICVALLITGCARNESGGEQQAAAPAVKQAAAVDAKRITAAADDPDNWLTYGRTYSEQRFSPLKQITAQNVSGLKLAWHYEPQTERGQEATPIVVDGVMYVSTAWSKVFAVDAASGRELWTFDPQVPGKAGVNACCDVVNRGVAVWNGKVYVGTIDGRLVAIDAATGKQVWSQLTVDPKLPYTITGAPRVVKGNVLIGNGGAEMGPVRGYVSAYDAETGKLAWRFFTVPGDPSKGFENKAMEMAAKTWKGDWWKYGGGGTAWDALAYDPEFDLIYIGVGNGHPWDQELRSPGGGDNLFLASIVAIRADTGEYVWHYQTTPGETWDFTATQHIILADLTIDGRERKVLMQAPKNGLFYVIDRATGEFISAQKYIDINWATGLDPKTHRPIENEQARWGRYKEAFLSLPGPPGGHNWQPMSYSPLTRLVYIPVLEMGFPYLRNDKFDDRLTHVYNAGSHLWAATLPLDSAQRKKALQGTRGHLAAWDPIQQKEIWRVQYDQPWNGGLLSTAGNLVFQGTQGGEFAAYDATTGAKTWSIDAQTGIVAPAISYAVNGEQYVAVFAGMGGAYPLTAGDAARDTFPRPNTPRLLAFKLNGTDRLPAKPSPPARVALDPPPAAASAATVEIGNAQYHLSCFACHGIAAISGEIVPDLRYSAALANPDAWRSIVQDGALEARGMMAFGSVLKPEQIEAIRAYVIQRANDSRASQSRASSARE